MATYISLEAQVYRNFRWIVIDGNSTDGAVEWLSTLKNNYTEYKSERDRNLYDAMNKGLRKAVSQPGYTLFLNSGDTFHNSDVLHTVNDAIQSSHVMPYYVYGDYCLSNAQGMARKVKAKSIERLKLGMITSHQAMYFENEKLSRVYFREDFSLSADYCMIVEFVANIKNLSGILKIPHVLCNFDATGVSQVHRLLALKQDMIIRKRFMRLSSLQARSLFFLHFLHTYLKIFRKRLGSF
jgi:putative colanic acid biosynthesis glycosyltransferase